MDLLYLLDRLDEVLSEGSRLPFSSRVIVDEQDYLDVVDQIRLALPEEFKSSRRVMAERDQILAEAREQAARVLERAQERAAGLLEEHSLIQAADERARALLGRAEEEAAETRAQADDYAYRVLSSLNNRLLQIGTIVQEGLAELRPDRRRIEE